MEAGNSILLYGSEIWAPILQTRTRAKKLLSAQRIAALRVTSSFRTVSTQAVLVTAGMTPTDLQAIERRMIFNVRHSMTQPESIEAIRHEVFLRWQSRWENEEHGRWTYELIPVSKVRKNRKYGEVDYYLTRQMFAT